MRCARLGIDTDDHFRFFERRDQRLLPHARQDHRRRHNQECHNGEGQSGVVQEGLDDPLIGFRHRRGDRRRVGSRRATVEQQDRQDRRDAEPDHQADDHGQGISVTDGLQERTGDALHEKDGDQHQQDDQRGVHQDATHLDGGFANDPCDRFLAATLTMLAETVHKVMDVDDRIVDDRRHGDQQPRDNQHVDLDSQQVDHQSRSHHRQRDGDYAD